MTATILPARSPSGSPVYAPTSRPVYRGGAAPGGGSFDWTQFFGVSDSGFVYDGSLSRFYTDSAMTTLATASGTDPVGGIEDISGKGNHAIQTQSGNKPVYYTNGTIQSMSMGGFAINRYMSTTSPLNTTAAFTRIAIWKYETSQGNGTYIISNYNAGWTDSKYDLLGHVGAVSTTDAAADSDASIMTVAGTPVGTYIKAFSERAGLGTNQMTLSVYDLDGVSVGTATGTEPTETIGPMIIGAIGLTGNGKANLCFLMHIDRALTAPERASIVTQLNSTFAGWTV